MDEVLETYRKLGSKKRVFAEILIYTFIAFHTQNKSGIEIAKSSRKTINGKRTVKYEIEVAYDD
ncbi:hypothetical protein [Enterococcus gilvus]|uniref:Uncharacterized protein n=1 Tax=Enterococcus gilvus ATCC BAA-350 TaxID=1158614 RepID=R2Y572_9ENTE|nr:hypothetical protein [Enterococcus gilvus]EOI57472.1 hypothetical protein UKC_01689 [Enterococcus gilvus ATCC BAA-350]EOW82954.1 hypothetical protein I592_02278 [Enterococcus gilvus ATCC BAA-350]OJG40882.1 hypothetical protein RV02_GL001736 [Enterococcus gilvus]